MFDFIKYIFGKYNEPDVHDHLIKYLSYSNTLISLGLFGAIFFYKLEFNIYFENVKLSIQTLADLSVFNKLPLILEGSKKLISERFIDCIFAVFVAVWYFAYKSAVAREVVLLRDFYADDNAPRDWENISGGKMVPFLSIGITIAFIALAASIDNLLMFCAIMHFLLCQDAFGNNTLRKNILHHFYDKELEPALADPAREMILQKRQIALEYWVWKPQIARIGIMMCIVSLLSALSIAGEVYSLIIADWFLKLCLIFVIILNEITMLKWRYERDTSLMLIKKSIK